VIKEHNEILNKTLNRRGRQIAEHLLTLLLPKKKRKRRKGGKGAQYQRCFTRPCRLNNKHRLHGYIYTKSCENRGKLLMA
jgi:hypothetical protein